MTSKPLSPTELLVPVPRSVRIAARFLCGVSIAVILIDTALTGGLFRLGIFPVPVFYAAVAVLVFSLWPVYQDLLEARRLKQRRFHEREIQLRQAIDDPALHEHADRSRHVT